jgi:two-component system, sporulation sensor kinase E
MPPKSSFLDKVLGRIGRLDAEGLQTVVQRLARERSFLETLFNTIEDGILVLDENGRILYLNSAVTKLLGIQGGNVEGQLVTRYFPELDWQGLLALDSQGGTKVTRHEFELTYPKLTYLHLYAAPLDGEKSGSAGVALILHDATEARQKTYEAIENERVQALTLLAASVAHEIGNPLNALHIHLQLMERELKKVRRLSAPEDDGLAAPNGQADKSLSRLDEYVKVARGEIARLDYIVTQFLDALRPRTPKLSPASLNDVVEETLELLKPEIENRGLTTVKKLSHPLPKAPFDQVQIQQVLVNLIKNAMQSMSRGGELTIQTGAGGEAVWVSISDTGTGIPEEKLNRIFEPFFTTKKKGSGLGLMIVQRIIRDHGGRIDLESKAGKGTTFRVWLPLHERQRRLIGFGTEHSSEHNNKGGE